MHVLVVAPSLPYPPNQGQRLRTWHLLSALADPTARAQVTLMTWSRSDTPASHREAVSDIVAELVDLPLRHASSSLPRKLWRHVRFLSGGRPTYVQAMAEERGLNGRGKHELARRILDETRTPDVIVLEEEALADLPVPRSGCPVVLHRLNVFERVVADVPPQNWFRRLTRQLELRAWRQFDRRVSATATMVIATTADSANALQVVAPAIPVRVVTNGVEIAPTPHRPADGEDIAFIGWMGYPANIDAARWFVEHIWPQIRTAVPHCKVQIIGRNPSQAVVALASDDVIVTGEVADVVEAAATARVGVVPLRGGMGIKNKTLELLAMGLPVVSTRAGLEGLPQPQAGVICADAPGEFAAAVIALLEDPNRANSLGAEGLQYAKDNFAWVPIGNSYVTLLHSLLDDESLSAR